MPDRDKSKEQLLCELRETREKLSAMEATEARLVAAEKVLRESEERLRLLYETVPLGYQSLDENGYFLEVNQAWLDTLGYNREEVIGRWFGDFLASGHQDHFNINFPTFKAAGEIHRVEFEMLRKDGSPITVAFDGKIERDEQGRFRQTHCILHDISECKKAEESLYRANQEWERTFNAISDGIMVLDDQHKIIRANKAMANALGMTERDLIGKRCFEHIHGTKEPPAVCPHTQLLMDGEEHSAEVAEPRFGGTYDVRVSPLVDQKGQVIGSVHVTRDITKRKLAETVLQQSNDLLRAIIEAAPTAIIGLDLDGNVQMVWNPAAEKMLGWSTKEVMGRPLPSVPAESQEEFKGFRERIRSGKTLEGVEVRRQRRDGSPIDYSIYASPLHDVNGRITGNIAVLVDITQQKRTEDDLRRSEAKFLDLYENAPCAYFSVGTDSIIGLCNRRAEELLGYSRDQLMGKPVFDLYSDTPEGKGRARKVFERFLAGLPVVDQELQMQKADGSPLWISLTVNGIRDSNGHLVESRSMVLDISDRKRAEEALSESEAFYRSLYENISDCIFIVDVTPEGRFKFVSFNPAEERAVGLTTDQVANRFTDDLFPKEVAEHINNHYQMCVQKRETIHYEEVLDVPKGKVSFLTSLVPIEGPDGRIYRIIGVARDITEEKSLQRQLIQAQKMEAIGQLAGGVAHDFNNILTAIIGYSDVLTRRIPADSPYRSEIVQINRAGIRAAHLTRQLLAFSRKQILDLRPLNLNEVIAGFQKMLKPLIGEDIEVVVYLDPSIGIIMGDQTQIEQILLNLAINSRDAMPTGGKLTIETANVSLDEAYARTHPEVRPGPYVTLAVSDTGYGIDPQVLPRVFDPFFTTKEKEKGTGLGLSTVYGIVKQHQGHVSAYSESGRGTTFKVYLPIVQRPPVHTSASPAAAAATQLRGWETVLVVEDDEIVRQLTAEVLETLGYSVLQCSNPQEARTVCMEHQGPIHLLLTDVVLPQMDGRRLFDSLSQQFPEMKVLYVSGYAENAIVHHGVLDAGVNFLQKPFTVQDLAKKVREVLDSE
ncbi:MAG: PAS domain S-box protein [Thermodesulfobacteriota bacterium]